MNTQTLIKQRELEMLARIEMQERKTRHATKWQRIKAWFNQINI